MYVSQWVMKVKFCVTGLYSVNDSIVLLQRMERNKFYEQVNALQNYF